MVIRGQPSSDQALSLQLTVVYFHSWLTSNVVINVVIIFLAVR